MLFGDAKKMLEEVQGADGLRAGAWSMTNDDEQGSGAGPRNDGATRHLSCIAGRITRRLA